MEQSVSLRAAKSSQTFQAKGTGRAKGAVFFAVGSCGKMGTLFADNADGICPPGEASIRRRKEERVIPVKRKPRTAMTRLKAA